MCKNGHRYRRLSDSQIFCSRCGEARSINSAPYWTWTTNVNADPTLTYNTLTTSTWRGTQDAALRPDAVGDPKGELHEEGQENQESDPGRPRQDH